MQPGLHALSAILAALVVFAVLHRLRLRLGRAMVVSALTLSCLLGATPRCLWNTLRSEWHAKALAETTPFLFVTLTGLVMLVNVLGAAMQETGVSARLAPALQALFRSRRAALAVIPLLMGMLPTPGGIMLSAPMVRELGDRTGVTRDRQAAVNFFFRHQLETVWPLFPAVPLVQAMLRVPPARLLAHNLVISLAGLAAGTVCLLLTGFPPAPEARQRLTARAAVASLRDFGHAFWPIALTAALYLVLSLPAAVGILLATALLLAAHRVPLARWRALCLSALEWDYAWLILGALLYKLDLEAVHAVAAITAYLQDAQVPVPALIFGLPFLVGYVTGVTMPSVAMTFPLLKAFIGEGAGVNLGHEVLAFAGVICGLLLTPVHLCLALSASYFQAPLGRILRLVLPPTLAVAAIAFLVALL